MEKLIPVILIFSVLSTFNPAWLGTNPGQLYVIDISAIEANPAGVERFVPDAQISLINLSSGEKVRPSHQTSQGTTFAFYADSRDLKYSIDVVNRGYQAKKSPEFDLKKVKKYTWKKVYLEKTP